MEQEELLLVIVLLDLFFLGQRLLVVIVLEQRMVKYVTRAVTSVDEASKHGVTLSHRVHLLAL